ncbi:MAG: MATE family efflux transporter, partial [Hyphomicrobiales bacterium]
GARQGDLLLAANAVLMHLFIMGGYLLDGLATAAEQLGGRALGANYKKGFITTVRLSSLWSFVIALLLAGIFWLAGPFIIDVMTTEPNVRALAREYLIYAALTPLIGVMAFIMDGVFIGATWSKDMRNMMLLSLVLYLACWKVLVPIWGNTGLWISLWVFLGARGLTLWLVSRRRIEETFG